MAPQVVISEDQSTYFDPSAPRHMSARFSRFSRGSRSVRFTNEQIDRLQKDSTEVIWSVLTWDTTNLSKVFTMVSGVENCLIRSMGDVIEREPEMIITMMSAADGIMKFQYCADQVWERLLVEADVTQIPECLHLMIIKSYVFLGIYNEEQQASGYSGEYAGIHANYVRRLSRYLQSLSASGIMSTILTNSSGSGGETEDELLGRSLLKRHLLLCLMTPTKSIRENFGKRHKRDSPIHFEL